MKKARFERNELLWSGEFGLAELEGNQAAMEALYGVPPSQFFNTIEVPEVLPEVLPVFEWPDFTTNYANRDTEESFTGVAEIQEQQQVEALKPPSVFNTTSVLPFSRDSKVSRSSSEAHSYLVQLEGREQKWRETLSAMYRSYSPGAALSKVQEVEKHIIGEMTDIEKMLYNEVLDVTDVFSALSLKNKYRIDLHQCNVLEHEELQLLEDASNHVSMSSESSASASAQHAQELVTLDWIDQPLPRSFKNKNRARANKKKKRGHCTMSAKVICAPGVQFTATSPVTAHFYWAEDDQVKAKRGGAAAGKKRDASSSVVESQRISDIQIQNNIEKLVNGKVSFDFRFPVGTKNKPCCIRLHVNGVVTLRDGTKQNLEIISEPTHRFIVTTNESQYETAELKLLMMDLFPQGAEQCSWAAFVNALSVRWMRVTRQESDSGISVVSERTLSDDDLKYVSQFFPNAPKSVTRDQVVGFYEIFGKATHHFRHNTALRQLLMDGIIWGLLSKKQAVEYLTNQSPGTFLIRAAEKNAGSFCVSWKHENNTVRHALIDNKLLAPPASGLVDNLLSKPFLKYLLQPFAIVNNSNTKQTTLRSKFDALALYANVKLPQEQVNLPRDSGYEDLADL